MLFEDYQDGHHGSHLGYWNGTILAILNLCHCHASHQVLAQSNLWFGRRCRLKISSWPPWRPSWISKRNDFKNSEYLCRCDAFH